MYVTVDRNAYRVSTFRDQYLKVGSYLHAWLLSFVGGYLSQHLHVTGARRNTIYRQKETLCNNHNLFFFPSFYPSFDMCQIFNLVLEMNTMVFLRSSSLINSFCSNVLSSGQCLRRSSLYRGLVCKTCSGVWGPAIWRMAHPDSIKVCSESCERKIVVCDVLIHFDVVGLYKKSMIIKINICIIRT